MPRLYQAGHCFLLLVAEVYFTVRPFLYFPLAAWSMVMEREQEPNKTIKPRIRKSFFIITGFRLINTCKTFYTGRWYAGFVNLAGFLPDFRWISN